MQTDMEMGIEPNNDKLTISKHSRQLSRWIGEQLTILAEAFGEILTPQRVRIYASDLADVGHAHLVIAFQRARRECHFFPKIAELRELAGAGRSEQDAEARRAWDELAMFVRRYVSNDVHGNYGPEHGWHPQDYPDLSDRLLDTVRRTGGWKVYACMTDADFPFVQKRFFEEYKAWTAVEQIRPDRILGEVQVKLKELSATKVIP